MNCSSVMDGSRKIDGEHRHDNLYLIHTASKSAAEMKEIYLVLERFSEGSKSIVLM